jgi:hypothetical protein
VGENPILSPSTPSSRPARKEALGVGIADQSRESKPAITSSSAAASVTVRVIGPAWERVPKGLAG